jgi:hypothetical protein
LVCWWCICFIIQGKGNRDVNWRELECLNS